MKQIFFISIASFLVIIAMVSGFIVIDALLTLGGERLTQLGVIWSEHPLTRVDPLANHLVHGRLARYRHSYYWTLIPNASAVSTGGARYSINSKGLNGPEFNLEPDEGVFRIIALGDSSVFGWEVEEDDSYPRLLEAALNEMAIGKRIEVINAGVPSYNSTQGLILFTTDLLAYEPDMLIVSFGWNDSVHPTAYLEFGRPGVIQGDPSSIKHAFLIQRTRLLGGLIRLTLLRFSAQGTLRQVDEAVAPQESPTLRIERNVSIFRENVTRLGEICREGGIELVVAPISCPPPFYAEAMSAATEQKALFIDFENALRDANKAEIATWKSAGFTASPDSIQSVDNGGGGAFRKMRHNGDLFMDACHPNARGISILSLHAALALHERYPELFGLPQSRHVATLQKVESKPEDDIKSSPVQNSGTRRGARTKAAVKSSRSN